MRTTRNIYAVVTLLVMSFSSIYEFFSHQVYSNAMIFAFVYPLIGGVALYGALAWIGERFQPPVPAQCLYNSGIAALTVGSLFQGILEIYGTTNYLSAIYPMAGWGLVVIGAVVWAWSVLWSFQAGRPQVMNRQGFGRADVA